MTSPSPDLRLRGAAAQEEESPERDPLAILEVIDRLEVGPPELTPRRLRATYRVSIGGRTHTHDLLYRYEEPVFDPDSWDARNLASMIAAQVALNYGLFCREIVIGGELDATDRRFLEDMLHNTSREILVNKLLAPNPFLRGPITRLPVVRRQRYTRALLRFPDGGSDDSADRRSWEVDPTRWAVLSSGGKESLLSYGLLRELGCEPHPIFVNESGRHWLSALNAYRGLRDLVPATGRVWTSSDRLFSWMLRHLPFVRPDFHDLRADVYPIRLWTVAVFLFGALPLLRRRGIGRLVIGDEHDTTVRASFQGIRHHAGLYDQSRYFDHALSRYFQRKDWGVTQLSLLRQLSELLVEKTLAERYPDLLELQVSCHAAHKAGERVRPCGRCEKCRRVAGMLIALGADPGRCGYGADQQARMLEVLMEKGVHQEREDAQHLAHLLHQKGSLPQPRLGAVAASPRPEVMKLRVHPERSPVDELPLAVRQGVLGILLQHAEGAAKRVGRQWVDLELMSAPEMTHPYLFDRKLAQPGSRAAHGPQGPGSYRWGELTWPQIRERLAVVDTALLPVGALEQHGHHLPLDTDAFDAGHLCEAVAAACSDPKPLVLPLVPYGVSYHHDDFPGTISIGNETLARLVYEIGMSVARNGITKLVIVNGHGGNGPTLHFAAQMINRDSRIFTCVDSGESSDADIAALTETPNDVHAGEIETSTSLALRPELVRMEEAKRFVPRFSSEYLDFESKRSVGWYARTERISKHGVFGDPSKASREKGERMWRIMVERLLDLVDHLKDLSLAEIHDRRY